MERRTAQARKVAQILHHVAQRAPIAESRQYIAGRARAGDKDALRKPEGRYFLGPDRGAHDYKQHLKLLSVVNGPSDKPSKNIN